MEDSDRCSKTGGGPGLFCGNSRNSRVDTVISRIQVNCKYLASLPLDVTEQRKGLARPFGEEQSSFVALLSQMRASDAVLASINRGGFQIHGTVACHFVCILAIFLRFHASRRFACVGLIFADQ